MSYLDKLKQYLATKPAEEAEESLTDRIANYAPKQTGRQSAAAQPNKYPLAMAAQPGYGDPAAVENNVQKKFKKAYELMINIGSLLTDYATMMLDIVKQYADMLAPTFYSGNQELCPVYAGAMQQPLCGNRGLGVSGARGGQPAQYGSGLEGAVTQYAPSAAQSSISYSAGSVSSRSYAPSAAGSGKR